MIRVLLVQCLVLCVFTLCVSSLPAVPITPVREYAAIPPSGDSYPLLLPQFTKSVPLAGVRVLFVIAHGVEDHEVIYEHAYFTQRGANVSIGCDGLGSVKGHQDQVVISDFIRPTYVLSCIPIAKLKLTDYDVVYIAGGLPSSSALRVNADFISKLMIYYHTPNKLLSIICSGSETMIEADMLMMLKNITGSPASRLSLMAALRSIGHSVSDYQGDDNGVFSITYKGDAHHATLVLGRNPDASPHFVVEIGNYFHLNEVVPTSPSNGIALPLINGLYSYPGFEPVLSIDQLPPFVNHSYPAAPVSSQLAGVAVNIAIGPGADFEQVEYLYQYFAYQGAATTFICPNWVPQWKAGQVFLASSPPVQIPAFASCTVGFSNAPAAAALVVPGGLFSTNGVLRNDEDLVMLLDKQLQSGKVVGLFDTGMALLMAHRPALGSIVPFDVFTNVDLTNSGYIVNATHYVYTPTPQLVLGVHDVQSFAQTVQQHLKSNVSELILF